jgi:imidazolonepropionase-like amidohydrolase
VDPDLVVRAGRLLDGRLVTPSFVDAHTATTTTSHRPAQQAIA